MHMSLTMIDTANWLSTLVHETSITIFLSYIFCVLVWVNQQTDQISLHRIKHETKIVAKDIVLWGFILFRHLGIPIGLLVSAVGPLRIFLNLDELGALELVASPGLVDIYSQLVMTSIFYGMIFAGLGFFISSKFQHLIEDRRKNKVSVLSVVITNIFIIFGPMLLAFDGQLDTLFSSPSLFALAWVGLIMILAVSFSNSENRFQLLAKASLFGALITTILGLIIQYSSQGIGIVLAFSGVTFGLFAYICIYMFSYCYDCVAQVKPDRMSWHWIEAYAFILFMFLAPATAKDVIFADEQASQIERLEQRIEQLENSRAINLESKE